MLLRAFKWERKGQTDDEIYTDGSGSLPAGSKFPIKLDQNSPWLCSFSLKTFSLPLGYLSLGACVDIHTNFYMKK